MELARNILPDESAEMSQEVEANGHLHGLVVPGKTGVFSSVMTLLRETNGLYPPQEVRRKYRHNGETIMRPLNDDELESYSILADHYGSEKPTLVVHLHPNGPRIKYEGRVGWKINNALASHTHSYRIEADTLAEAHHIFGFCKLHHHIAVECLGKRKKS